MWKSAERIIMRRLPADKLEFVSKLWNDLVYSSIVDGLKLDEKRYLRTDRESRIVK